MRAGAAGQPGRSPSGGGDLTVSTNANQPGSRIDPLRGGSLLKKRTTEDVLAVAARLESGCIIWPGHIAKNGYGHAGDGLAHRWIYECLVGPIPDKMEIDHVFEKGCISRACINVEHLEVVTHAENMRRLKMKPFCRSGRHMMTPDNVEVHSDGSRKCRACKNERQRRDWHNKRRAEGIA